MSSATLDSAVIELLAKSKPSVSISSSSDPVAISAAYFGIEYSPEEQSSIGELLSTYSRIGAANEDDKTMIGQLNGFLASRTTLLGWKPSVADVAVWRLVAPIVAKWSGDERTGENGKHHVVRFVDFVQNAPVYGPLSVEKVSIDPSDVRVPIKPVDMKAAKERKKQLEKEAAEAAAAAAAKADGAAGDVADKVAQAVKTGAKAVGSVVEEVTVALESTSIAAAAAGAGEEGKQQKKEKKKKEKKPAPPPPAEKLVGPSMIDLRVGHILKAVCHPNADSLFVSTMDCGDAPGTDNTSFNEEFGKTVRTVCSGLNGLVPLEEMQGRKVVAVCNLKPVTMRGVKSCAMVLAASPRDAENHGGPVELVNVPEGAVAGDRVYFEGWEGEPEGVLNPKKKIWEAVQPGFLTTEKLEVGFDPKATESEAILKQAEAKPNVAVLRTKDGVCTVKSLVNATVR